MSEHDSHGDGHHAHHPHQAHHWDSMRQQFEAGKLGMWLFLATEVLLFGGLFCAYFIYRANYPELYEYGHHALDKVWGAINTVVLLVSSLTMALAVRASQVGNRKQLQAMLAITFLCGCGFMGIKAVEYKAKIDHGYLPGKLFNYAKTIEHEHEGHGHDGDHHDDHHGDGVAHAEGVFGAPAVSVVAPLEQTAQAQPAAPPSGLSASASRVAGDHAEHGHEDGDHGGHDGYLPVDGRPPNIHIFFSIYFMMTGLHGIHVLIGMAVIAWLLVVCRDGRFGPSYFTPVEIGGLYWHLVDLIWIFLFPLLYLI